MNLTPFNFPEKRQRRGALRPQDYMNSLTIFDRIAHMWLRAPLKSVQHHCANETQTRDAAGIFVRFIAQFQVGVSHENMDFQD